MSLVQDCTCYQCERERADLREFKSSADGVMMSSSSAITDDGTSTPEQLPKRTAARICGFFASTQCRARKLSSMGLCGAEPLSGGEGRFFGSDSGIPTQRPPFLHSTRSDGNRKLPKRAVLMPNLFVLREGVDTSTLVSSIQDISTRLKGFDLALFTLCQSAGDMHAHADVIDALHACIANEAYALELLSNELEKRVSALEGGV